MPFRVLVVILWLVAPAAARAEELFRDRVAPILERHCLRCHGTEAPKGGFSLVTRQALLTGGENGPAIEPGNAGESLLIEMIIGEKPQMPKGSRPLSAKEIGTLREWIDAGAQWPDGLALRDRQFEGQAWWSLLPLKRPSPPAIEPGSTLSGWARNPIDLFIWRALASHGMRPSPEASRRVLIRRVAFDLVGLPPSPEEVEAFIADPDPGAYERLVDRLLESPAHGERWARHWLDVVHFGESHGYDKDKPRPNAWPYRDYVVRSLNHDKPYDQFVMEQVAGDVLFPRERDGIVALGFLAAGPWDFIGHAEVPETKIDGKIARHLDRDDMVTNTIQTFNSLTVQCAQCHDHKFDPITQEDYYGLQAVFAAVDRTERPFDDDPEVARRRAMLSARLHAAASREAVILAAVAQRAGAPLAELDQAISSKRKQVVQGAPPQTEAFGYHSGIESRDDALKWVQVDLGEPRELAKIVLRPCHDDFNKIGDGFGFPVRFKVETADDENFTSNVEVVLDQTSADVANPKLAPRGVAVEGRTARYVRVTATRLAPRQNDYIFALAELEVFDAAGANVALGKAVAALDAIEAPPRWRKANLTDGKHPGREAGQREELEALERKREELWNAQVTAAEAQELAALRIERETALRDLAALPAQQLVYACGIHTGEGAFRGTGHEGGKPRAIYVLERGSVLRPRQESQPGALAAVSGLPGRFALPADATEADRRAALARWLADPRNPLTWRSIVNRTWQYHFGRGIVETANDFGRNGALPTHPELLDWLAAEFVDSGMSLKRLHRLIVTSATYRQSSGMGAASAGIDAENRYLSRMPRRRLEAEALRDGVLLLAGRLDRRIGGPSFQDFVIEKPEHSPHYEYHLHDPNDPASHRRSIYRFAVRSQQQPFMTLLDCADPSMQVDRRNESLAALQALALLNNGFMLTMAGHYANRLEQVEPNLERRVRRAWYECTGSPPDEPTRDALAGFAREHGLPNLCRLLFNLTEFVFVD
jgi:mono/diheme cytochrome c family protein